MSKGICSIICFFFITSICFGQKQVHKLNNDFAFKLFHEVYEKDKNTMISPYSILSAFMMVYEGADGNTKKQIQHVFNFDEQLKANQSFRLFHDQVDKTPVYVASALWKNETTSFHESFIKLTQEYYDVDIYPLKDKKAVNSWIFDKTYGTINEIVTDEDLNNANMILTNTIFFWKVWEHKFETTHKDNFTTSTNKVISTDMMISEDKFSFIEDDTKKAISIPYQGKHQSMVIIVPKGDNTLKNIITPDLEPFIDKLYPSVKTLFDSTYQKPTQQKLSIPRFSCTADFDLHETLSAMGMSDAFDANKANFNKLSASKLHLKKTIHKAFIHVDEKGTTAGKQTMIVPIKQGEPGITFNANKPFLFLIRDDNTETILFIGSIADPTLN